MNDQSILERAQFAAIVSIFGDAGIDISKCDCAEQDYDLVPDFFRMIEEVIAESKGYAALMNIRIDAAHRPA